MSGDLNVVHADSLARVDDAVGRVVAPTQNELDLIHDGAVADPRRRDRRRRRHRPRCSRRTAVTSVPTIDATGRRVLPGLVECHSHPIFAGERHHEYAERLGGASLAEVAARGGGIWSSVMATRAPSDDELLARLGRRLRADHRRRRHHARGQVGLRPHGRRGAARARSAAARRERRRRCRLVDHLPRRPRRAPRPEAAPADRPRRSLHATDRRRDVAGRGGPGHRRVPRCHRRGRLLHPAQALRLMARSHEVGCRCGCTPTPGARRPAGQRRRGRRGLGRAPHLHARRRDPRRLAHRHDRRGPADRRADLHDVAGPTLGC